MFRRGRSRREILLLAGAAAAAPVVAAPFVLRKGALPTLRELTGPAPAERSGNDPGAVAAAEAYVAPWMAGKSAPGAVLGVIREGEPILKWSYGVRAVNDPAQPDADTVFHIASVAKTITGYALLLLVQDGRIELDAPASLYLPELPAAWAPITVRQFLCHVSGIQTVGAFFGDDWGKALEAAGKVKVRPPGKEMKYNNFNYVVLGKLIERLSGHTYAGFVEQRIFGPLGMTRSFIGRGFYPNQASGNLPSKTGWFTPTRTHLGAAYWAPAGWIQSSLNDVMAFVGAVQQKRLLHEPVWENVVRRYAPDVRGAGGWFAKTVDGVPTWEKLGRIAGFSADVEFNARGDAIVLMWNCQTYRDDSIVARAALRKQLFGIGTGLVEGPTASVLNEQKWG
jgi:CubicO group peptidase (beta-lactamase class C family)